MADVAVTNAQLAAQLSQLVLNWNANEDQYGNWQAGTPTGGTAANGTGTGGYYPMTNAAGVVGYFLCPAAIAASAVAADLSNLSSAGVRALNRRILRRTWFLEG